MRTVRPRWTYTGTVYAYRTRKPGAVLGLPVLGRHWGYVGQTRNPDARHGEHMRGGGRYGGLPASWSDLDPKRYVLIKVPMCPQWLLLTLEAFFILILQPVYNVQRNKINLRRIGPARARRARVRRDVTGIRWSPVPTGAHLVMILVLIIMTWEAWT